MLVERVRHGVAAPDTIDLIEHSSQDMMGTSFCGLGQFAPWPVVSTVRNFRKEYEAHIIEKVCPAACVLWTALSRTSTSTAARSKKCSWRKSAASWPSAESFQALSGSGDSRKQCPLPCVAIP